MPTVIIESRQGEVLGQCRASVGGEFLGRWRRVTVYRGVSMRVVDLEAQRVVNVLA